MAPILVWADRVGRRGHGVYRLPIYAQRLQAGAYATPCRTEFVRTSAATGTVDGRNGFGHLVADDAMRHAMMLAGEAGVGLVTVHARSNHFGAAGYFANIAAESGCIGIAMSNAWPKVAGQGGTTPLLGTNPLAVAVPRGSAAPILVDMATSSISGSAVTLAEQRGGKAPANEVLQPFGGAKGWAVMLLVEILAGVLSGAGIGL